MYNNEKSSLENQIRELISANDWFKTCLENERVMLVVFSYYFGRSYAYNHLRRGHFADFFAQGSKHTLSLEYSTKLVDDLGKLWDSQNHLPLRESTNDKKIGIFGLEYLDSFVLDLYFGGTIYEDNEVSVLVFFSFFMGIRDFGIYLNTGALVDLISDDFKNNVLDTSIITDSLCEWCRSIHSDEIV